MKVKHLCWNWQKLEVGLPLSTTLDIPVCQYFKLIPTVLYTAAFEFMKIESFFFFKLIFTFLNLNILA